MVRVQITTNPNDKNAYGNKKYDVVYITLNNGSSIRYRTKNFSPNENFHIVRMDNILGFEYEFPEGTVQGYKFRDKYFKIVFIGISYKDTDFIKEYQQNLNNKDLDIICNYPYALAGYDFARKDLKGYFSQFIWYSPVSKNVKIDPLLKNITKAADEVKAKRYK